MAFAHGNESTNAASGSFKKFVGAASVKVLAVNPTVEEWNKLTGGNSTDEKVYTGEKDGVKNARVTFLCEIDAERSLDHSTGIIPVTFWLRKQAIKGSTSGKIKVIDKYGQTAWATEDEIKAGSIPQYSNGPANIDKDYRKCVAGEEELTKFLKALMCIPNARVYNRTTGTWEPNANLAECEARLDKVLSYFDGNIDEIKKILKSFPDNKARILFGVRNVDGKEYQDFLTTMFLTNGNGNNVAFQKELKAQLAIGRYQNTFFGDNDKSGDPLIMDVREYTIESTQYHDNPNAPAPTTASPEPEQKDDDLPF